ncbi:MAG: hypothetical protein Q9173_000896 [Seirophora scorigena]
MTLSEPNKPSPITHHVQPRRHHPLGQSPPRGARPPHPLTPRLGTPRQEPRRRNPPRGLEEPDHGLFLSKYPTVLGSDICGVVEAVGPDVTLFGKGDHVAGFAASVGNSDINQAAAVLGRLGGGGGKLALTLPFPEGAEKPDDVEVSNTMAFRINTDAKEFGAWLFNEWLSTALTDKTYMPSPEIQTVEGGLASVQKALDMHRKGLSGKKLEDMVENQF